MHIDVTKKDIHKDMLEDPSEECHALLKNVQTSEFFYMDHPDDLYMKVADSVVLNITKSKYTKVSTDAKTYKKKPSERLSELVKKMDDASERKINTTHTWV